MTILIYSLLPRVHDYFFFFLLVRVGSCQILSSINETSSFKTRSKSGIIKTWQNVQTMDPLEHCEE